MLKNYMASIEGISIYPVISLSIFFTFFVLLGIFVFKADKKYITHMENMPLSDENNNNKS